MSITEDECNGFGGWERFRWCLQVLRDLSQTKKAHGFSYGIRNDDIWSHKMSNRWGIKTTLKDCLCTVEKCPLVKPYTVPYVRRNICIAGANSIDEQGRKYQSLGADLAGRPKTGTLVKLDVEGWEWEALEAVSDEDLQKIDLLDVEFHWLLRIDNQEDILTVLQRRMRVVRRLLQAFWVTSRRQRLYEVKPYAGLTDDEAMIKVSRELRQTQWKWITEVSFVNKKHLKGKQR